MISSKFDIFIILNLYFFNWFCTWMIQTKNRDFVKMLEFLFLSKLAKFGKSKFSLIWKFVVVCTNFEQNSEFWQILQTQYCLIFAVICASNFHKSHILKSRGVGFFIFKNQWTFGSFEKSIKSANFLKKVKSKVNVWSLRKSKVTDWRNIKKNSKWPNSAMVQKPCKVDKKSQSKHTQIKKAKNKQEIKKKRKCGNFAEIKIFLEIRHGNIFICGLMKNQKFPDISKNMRDMKVVQNMNLCRMVFSCRNYPLNVHCYRI